MKFQIGDKIRFRYTGLRGEIIQDYMDGSYKVYDEEEGDDTIAFADDIVPEHAFKGVEQSELAKVKPKPEKKQHIPSTEEIFYGREEMKRRQKEALAAPIQQKHTPKLPVVQAKDKPPVSAPPPVVVAKPLEIVAQLPSDKGVFVGLHDTAAGYVVYLINDTPNSFSFDFQILLHQRIIQQLRHSITPHTFFPIGEVPMADMLESPNILLTIPAMGFEKNIKIKPKKLLESRLAAPLMGCDLYLFAAFEGKNPPTTAGDLKNYTNHFVQKHKPVVEEVVEKAVSVEKIAAFDWEIDLHFDKLVSEPSKYNPTQILPMQLKAAESFLERAEQMGIEQIFLIHGVGNGRLREQLHLLLKKRPSVLRFNNDWHHKYGAGATMVIFQKS